MKIDKVYILTYDENIREVWRIIADLAGVWINNIEIVKWVNKDNITIHDYWELLRRARYKINWETFSIDLKLYKWNDFMSLSWCACMIWHKIAFERAKKEWFENIMIIEDDLILWYWIQRYLGNTLDMVPDDRDMLRLERHPSEDINDIEIINPRWIRTSSARSTARMVFNKKAIDHMITIMNNKAFPSFDSVVNGQCKNLNSYTSLWNMWMQYPL